MSGRTGTLCCVILLFRLIAGHVAIRLFFASHRVTLLAHTVDASYTKRFIHYLRMAANVRATKRDPVLAEAARLHLIDDRGR